MRANGHVFHEKAIKYKEGIVGLCVNGFGAGLIVGALGLGVIFFFKKKIFF